MLRRMPGHIVVSLSNEFFYQELNYIQSLISPVVTEI